MTLFPKRILIASSALLACALTTLSPVQAQAVYPYAFDYGFNHIRYMLPNPQPNADRYRIHSESTIDRHHQWHSMLR